MKLNLNQESWNSVNLEEVIQSFLPHILLKIAFKMALDEGLRLFVCWGKEIFVLSLAN